MILLLVVTTVNAQTSLYTFSQSTGTYTEITGGTVLISCLDCGTTYDTNSYTATLPTPFLFNGTPVTDVVMRVDGSLVLGTTTLSSAQSPLSSTTVGTGVVSPLGMQLRNTGITGTLFEMRWLDNGTDYIFQWKNVARLTQHTVETLNFQAKLNKATGVISFIYGPMNNVAASETYQPQVGLRGTTTADYFSRSLTGSIPDLTPSWDDTVVSTTNTTASTVRFTTNLPAVFPPSGLTYIFTPPPPCSGIPSAGTVSTVLDRLICSGTAPGVITVPDAPL